MYWDQSAHALPALYQLVRGLPLRKLKRSFIPTGATSIATGVHLGVHVTASGLYECAASEVDVRKLVHASRASLGAEASDFSFTSLHILRDARAMPHVDRHNQGP